MRSHVLQVCPGFVESVFKLIAGVPTKYVQEALPEIILRVRDAFPQEFPSWLEAALQVLPPSAASAAERQKLGQQLVQGSQEYVEDAVQDICYRCEQVALRSRGGGSAAPKT